MMIMKQKEPFLILFPSHHHWKQYVYDVYVIWFAVIIWITLHQSGLMVMHWKKDG